MKTLLIVAILGASSLSTQAGSAISSERSYLSKPEKGRNEAEELKQKAEVQLYNLEMLVKQFKTAQEVVKNSKGNHKDIDKDFAYFSGFLLEDAKAKHGDAEIDKSMQGLKKAYARKHKVRAAAELKEQKAIAASMQKELNYYLHEWKLLKGKYRKHLKESNSRELDRLASELEKAKMMLKESAARHVETAAYYNRKLEDVKKV